jgi:hypothetical protein
MTVVQSLVLRMVDGQGDFQQGLELPAVLRHEDHPIICLLWYRRVNKGTHQQRGCDLLFIGFA